MHFSCCHCSDTLCDMGAIEQLVGLLTMEHRPFHEQLMVALYHLIADNERAKARCHQPHLALKSLLLDRKHILEGKEEFTVGTDLFSSLQLYVCTGGYKICHILKWFNWPWGHRIALSL